MPSNASRGPRPTDIVLRRTSPLLFPALWFVIFTGAIIASGPWAGTHGFLLAVVGVMMVIFPPVVTLPKKWWALAGGFLLFGAMAFLPASWFGIPEWRKNLEALGLPMSSLVAIQPRLALENYLLLAATMMTGFWIAGHRVPSKQFRKLALAFTIGVAIYAIFAHFRKDTNAAGTFGFFPNRNHTGTYLAMGALCGIGATAQFIREKRFYPLGAALLATGICFWALFFWSSSRGGVALAAGGAILWLIILGPGYLGKSGRRSIALMAVLLAGAFLLSESRVKDRMTETASKVSGLSSDLSPAELGNLDLRIPIVLDTFQLIRHFPWTGVGAGHFYFVIPQYRGNTAAWSESPLFHPNSDWLWIAAEMGIFSTICLLLLVILACKYSLTLIAMGRDRALRTGALVAAILLPLHGLTDVPGHRIALAWAAMFMLMLSIRGAREKFTTNASVWIQRGAGVLVLIAGLWMTRTQWAGDGALVTPLSAEYFHEAVKLAQQDRSSHVTSEEPDKTLAALRLLNEAAAKVPMDFKLYYAIGAYSSLYENSNPEVERAFAIEQALCPYAANVPFRQASVWQKDAPEKALDAWEEALRRAGNIDLNLPNSRWSEAATLGRIQQATRNHPELFKELQDR